jgi:hypothetical protein
MEPYESRNRESLLFLFLIQQIAIPHPRFVRDSGLEVCVQLPWDAYVSEIPGRESHIPCHTMAETMTCIVQNSLAACLPEHTGPTTTVRLLNFRDRTSAHAAASCLWISSGTCSLR